MVLLTVGGKLEVEMKLQLYRFVVFSLFIVDSNDFYSPQTF